MQPPAACPSRPARLTGKPQEVALLEHRVVVNHLCCRAVSALDLKQVQAVDAAQADLGLEALCGGWWR
jgi:hypothetical protein